MDFSTGSVGLGVAITSVKVPRTDKRVSRMNPESEWVISSA